MLYSSFFSEHGINFSGMRSKIDVKLVSFIHAFNKKITIYFLIHQQKIWHGKFLRLLGSSASFILFLRVYEHFFMLLKKSKSQFYGSEAIVIFRLLDILTWPLYICYQYTD